MTALLINLETSGDLKAVKEAVSLKKDNLLENFRKSFDLELSSSIPQYIESIIKCLPAASEKNDINNLIQPLRERIKAELEVIISSLKAMERTKQQLKVEDLHKIEESVLFIKETVSLLRKELPSKKDTKFLSPYSRIALTTSSKDALVAKIIAQEAKGLTLIDTDLSSANLSGAQLDRADLQEASLQGADLQGANLESAIIWEVQNCNLYQIKTAKNWEKAYYSPKLDQQLGLPLKETRSR